MRPEMLEKPIKLRATDLIPAFESVEAFQETDTEGLVRLLPTRSAGRMECVAFRPSGDGERGDRLCEARDVLFPELYVYRLRNVRLMMPYHILWHANGTRLSDITIYNGPVPAHLSVHPAGHLAGAYSILTNNNFNNYSHWLTECLPALHAAPRYGLDRLQAVLPPLQLPFHRPSAAALGINYLDAIQVATGVLTIDSLTFLSSVDHSRAPNSLWPEEMPALAGRLKRWALGKSQVSRPRLVYISRLQSPRRRCLDEAAFADRIVAMGFQAVAMETLPIEDQIAVVAEADVVVGLHGAGLTNLVYCRPGALFIELQPSATASSHFFRLSHQCSLRYAIYRERGEANGSPHAAWHLDVPAALNFVAAAMEAAQA